MTLKNLRNIGLKTLLVALPLAFAATVAWGQAEPAGFPLGGDPEIFPFAQTDSTAPTESSAPTDEASNVGFTENLYEITDNGIKDPNGNLIQPSTLPTTEVAPVKTTPALPGASEDLTSFEEYQASIIANWGGKKAYTEMRLADIKANLQAKQTDFTKLDKKIRHLEKAILPIQRQINSIGDEIGLLNGQIVDSKNKIKGVESQVAEKQISLKNLYYDLRAKEADLNAQRKVVLEYIVMMYREDEKFRGLVGEGSSTLKLLLADSSVSENLLGQDYLGILEQTGREVFYDLHKKKLALEEKRTEFATQQAELEQLNQDLNNERTVLEQNRQAKQELLAKTEGQEEAYQQMLEESLKQQLQSAIEIQNMRENVEFIEEKLKVLDESLAQVQQLAKSETPPDAIQEAESQLQASDASEGEPPVSEEPSAPARAHVFSWPVPPVAITAYFHDSAYPKKWGIHQAVDIRAKQFTEIRAPANAYVFQTKDNGKGYSYIILAHKNKFVTVYGHVTEILVKAGDTVKEGDVIGLSGGTPGTKGAGWQTTGPHLHFEVWHNGSQVDPLDWLPIEMLPIEYIPDRFLQELAPAIAK